MSGSGAPAREPPRVVRDRGRRDALAGTILAAFASRAAAAALAARAPAAAGESDPAARRLAAGAAAAARYWRRPPRGDALERALVQGALLFHARLFFEVHEVLEAAWRTLAGAERSLVQGLLQIAVGLHHLVHGNPRGAVGQLAAGRAKLARQAPVARGVALDALLAGLVAWEEAAARGASWPAGLALPPFRVATIQDGVLGGDDREPSGDAL